MSGLFKNWTYLLFSDVSQTIINFFVFIVLARKLAPEGYGEFNIILAVVALFTVFSNNSVSNHVITREVTLNPKSTNQIFKLFIPIRILSFIITGIALVIYINFKEINSNNVIIFSILLILSNTIWDISESIAFGHFVTKFTTIFNLCFSVIWLVVVICLPKEYSTSIVVISLYASLFIVRSIVYFIKISKSYILKNTNKINIGVKALLIMSFPYLWMRVLGVFTDQLPILFLDKYGGAKEVGFFSVGYRLIIPITIAINTGLRAAFPFMTKLYKEDKDRFDKKIIMSFSSVLIFGGIIAFLLVNFSDIWIPLFFGKSYTNSIESFNLLAWFGVILSFDLIISTILSSTYKQNTLAIITTIDVVVCFPLLYIGSKYGAIGLANSKLYTALFILIYHIIIVGKVLKIKILKKDFYLSFLFFIGMLIFSTTIFNFYIRNILFLITVIVFLHKKSPLMTTIEYMFNFIRKK